MKSKNFTNRNKSKIEKKLNRYYRGIWRLMCSTGLRVGDAVGVKFGDLDRDGYLHYTAQKTGKKARVRVPDDILRDIAPASGLGGTSPERYIFESPRIAGAHVTRQAVWKAIKKACKEAGVKSEGVSPHSCRKNFAIKDYKRGGLSSVMAHLQHSSPSTTYLYLYDENPIESVEKRLKNLTKRIKKIESCFEMIKKLTNDIQKLQYAVDLCCDKLIGDDCYGVTEEGRNALINLEEFDESFQILKKQNFKNKKGKLC